MIVQCRSNLVSLVRLVKAKKITDAHKHEIEKSPFGHLILAIIERPEEKYMKKNDHDALKLIQNYDSMSQEFNLGNKSLKPTENDLTLIFGICSGPRRIKLVNKHVKPNTEFTKRVFSNESSIRTKMLQKQISTALEKNDKENRKDVARLLTLFILATLFFPSTSRTLSWCYVDYVEDLENSKSYAWSTLITEFLLHELYKKSDSPRTVGGCVMGLMVKYSNFPLYYFSQMNLD